MEQTEMKTKQQQKKLWTICTTKSTSGIEMEYGYRVKTI